MDQTIAENKKNIGKIKKRRTKLKGKDINKKTSLKKQDKMQLKSQSKKVLKDIYQGMITC
jgi:hypothetical protein